MAIDWSGSATVTDPVRQAFFGTNMLFDRDRTGPAGTYDDALSALSVEHVRYPGGSIAEWYFDITDPDATRVYAEERGEWRDLMPLTDFLTWAGQAGIGASLVLPTGSLMTGTPGDRRPAATAYGDVHTFVTDVLGGRYGEARIEALEIGNEYWLGAELNHVEYARIANTVAEAAQDAIDAHRARAGLGPGWQEPDLVVQIGQYGRYSPTPGWIQNAQIMDALSDEAIRAIDAVTAHYYTRGGWADIPAHAYYFDRLDSWAADPRFAGIEYHVTEWNTQMGNTTETGLKHASALWRMAGEMVQRGVDAAQVWPIQQNTENDLAGREGETGLTIAGEAFRLMAEVLPGTRLTHHTVWEDGAAWVYAGGTATHVYIASRAGAPQTIRLDRRDLDLEGQLWWKTTLGSTGAPADATARPVLELRGDTDADTRHLAFALDPYELVRATFYDAPLPNAPGGGFPHALTGGGYEDTIVASDLGDRMEGRGGADTLDGGRGRDEIRAGPGDDRAAGHLGADTLEGGAGADTLLGGDGGDVILGGPGADRAEGGAGADLLAGGTGDDLLLGQGGDDTLWGGAGSDTLKGGTGDDVFVFTAGGGPDSVSGLPAGWDDGLWG